MKLTKVIRAKCVLAEICSKNAVMIIFLITLFAAV